MSDYYGDDDGGLYRRDDGEVFEWFGLGRDDWRPVRLSDEQLASVRRLSIEEAGRLIAERRLAAQAGLAEWDDTAFLALPLTGLYADDKLDLDEFGVLDLIEDDVFRDE